MKRLLKNASLLIITISLVLIFTDSAEAATRYGSVHGEVTTSECLNCGGTTTEKDSHKRDFYEYAEVELHTPNKIYYSGVYYWEHYEIDTGLDMQCLDAALSGMSDLYARRFLLEVDDGLVYAHDIAAMSIMTTSDIYMNKNVAIRTIEAVFGFERGVETDKQGRIDLLYSYTGMAYNWIKSDASIEASWNTIYSVFPGIPSLNSLGTYKDYYLKDKEGQTNHNYERAQKSMFAKALAEAAEYVASLNGTKKVAEVVESSSAAPAVPTPVQDNIGEHVSIEVTKTFTLKNFTLDEDAWFSIDSLEYVMPLTELGVNKQPIVSAIDVNGIPRCDENDSGGCERLFGKNLISATTPVGDDVIVKVTLKFEGYKSVKEYLSGRYSTLNCGQQPMEYTLKYSYYDKSLEKNNKYSDYLGIVWQSEIVGTDGNNQRFFTVEPIKKTEEEEQEEIQKKEIKGEISLIESCSCDELKKACELSGDYGSDDCDEFFAANCGLCDILDVQCTYGVKTDDNKDACSQELLLCDASCATTYKDEFECCDENDELIVSTVDNVPVDINGPSGTDLVACFVAQIDSQGVDVDEIDYSSVKGAVDEKSNSYTQEQNKYCVVSCKEDYAMTMPAAKLVNAGRYFTFKASANGTKSCYTNTINREQYNKDIAEAQRALIEAYNIWSSWNAANKAGKEEDIRNVQVSANPGTCEQGCNAKTDDLTFGAWTDSYNYDFFHITSTPTAEAKTGVVTGYMGSNIDKKGGSSQYTLIPAGSTTSVPCTPWEDRDPVTNKLLDSGCSGGCASESCGHNYVITKEYNMGTLSNEIAAGLSAAAKDLANAQDEYQAIIDAYNDCSEWETKINYDLELTYDYEEEYLEKYGKIGEMDKHLSPVNTSEWYCNSEVTSSGVETKKATLNNNEYDSCSASGSNYQTINYSYCTKNGCIAKSEKVSNTRFKKITSEVTASYEPSTLFYNIYPSGEITINSSDANVALENKLPVALNTSRGIYKYTLSMTNLGEYYKEGTLGRLIGGASAVIDTAKVEYACSYLVNIIETDGWICDFDDTCTNNCISNCIGPNCSDYCDGVECIAECVGVGCIYDEDAGTSLIEKTVSLNNLFPNGTTSYNWDKANDKAETTITEIENKGNSIYDETPILSITINGRTAEAINAYNKSLEDKGGYSNVTLDCYSIDGYSEIACYSEFITNLIAGKYGEDAVDEDNSLIADSSYRTVSDNNKDYFKIWDTVSEDDMIGPSWK